MKVKELLEVIDTEITEADFQDDCGNYKFTWDKKQKKPSNYYLNKTVVNIQSWDFDNNLLVTII